jgi:hypothetical protein
MKLCCGFWHFYFKLNIVFFAKFTILNKLSLIPSFHRQFSTRISNGLPVSSKYTSLAINLSKSSIIVNVGILNLILLLRSVVELELLVLVLRDDGRAMNIISLTHTLERVFFCVFLFLSFILIFFIKFFFLLLIQLIAYVVVFI